MLSYIFKYSLVMVLAVAVCHAKADERQHPIGAGSYVPDMPYASENQRSLEIPDTRKYGPFDFGEKRITLTYRYVDPTTGVVLEIKDDAGKSYFKEAHQISNDSLLDVVNAFKVESTTGEGIIVHYDFGPNAPPCGPELQIFGMKNGLFKPLSLKRIMFCGHFDNLPPGRSDKAFRLFKGDFFTVSVWNDSFSIRIPLKVDFQGMKVTPYVPRGIFEIDIPYDVDPVDTRFGTTLTIYSDHDKNSKRNSIEANNIHSVKFLKAYAEVQLAEASKFQHNIALSSVWLKVKLNGCEGWINDINDYQLLGLHWI